MRDTTRQKVLMILPVVPYPLRANGVSIRYLPIIRHLCKRYEIHLIIIDDAGKELGPLHDFCKKISVIKKPEKGRYAFFQKLLFFLVYLLPWSAPISYVYYGAKKTVASIVDVIERNNTHYDNLIFVSGTYAHLLHQIALATNTKRITIDFVDSAYLLALRRSIGQLKPEILQIYETWKIKHWEARLIRMADTSIYISRTDSQAVPLELTPRSRRDVVPNGVYIDDYTNVKNEAVKSPSIGFLGNMEYTPNIDAVNWLYNEIFAPLQKQHKPITLYIIGRNPVDSVVALGQNPNVFVTGTVDSIWPYVNSVDLFVLPMKRGAGLQNKILEAMYAGKPVITTTIGNEGIDAIPGRDLLTCSAEAECRDHVLELLSSATKRKQIGDAGQRFVRKQFELNRILAAFETAVLEGQ